MMWKSQARQASLHPMAWLGGLLILVTAVACGTQQPSGEVIGSGVSSSEQRSVPAFSSLNITAKAFDAYVAIGNPASVKVTTDDNIMPLVKTTVMNSELTVALNQVVSTHLGMRLDVTVPQLNSVKAGDGVKVHIVGMAGDQLDLRGDQGSQFTASGTAAKLTLTLGLGSRADLRELQARDAVVLLNGASTAEVLATNAVTGEAHQISHLGVWGVSPNVDVKTSEGSTVTMMGPAQMMPS